MSSATRISRRTRKACDECAHAKARCCGGQPCRRCLEHDRVCEYARACKKRGRKRANPYPLNDPPPSSDLYREEALALVEARIEDPTPSPGNSTYPSQQGIPDLHLGEGVSSFVAPATSGLSPAGRSAGLYVDSTRPHGGDDGAQSSTLAPTATAHVAGDACDGFPKNLWTHDRIVAESLLQTAQLPIEGNCSRASRELFAIGVPGPQRNKTTERLDKYACLGPLMPLIEDIIRPHTAYELLQLYFACREESVFNRASPFVVTPVIRECSIFDARNGRRTSLLLLATMIWVSAQTAHTSALLRPSARKLVCDGLGKVVMQLQRARDFEMQLHLRDSSTPLAANALDDTTETELCIDDILSVILITVVISGGENKASTIAWWQKAVRLARSNGLHRLDLPLAHSEDDMPSKKRHQYPFSLLEEEEEKRRVFWLLFCLDRHLALSYNRDPLLVDGEHHVFVPIPEDIWRDLDKFSETYIVEERRGPPLTITGFGFFEWFLPLMAILGDVITSRRLNNHPRLASLGREDCIESIEKSIESYNRSVQDLCDRTSTTGAAPGPEETQGPTPRDQHCASEDAGDSSSTPAVRKNPSQHGALVLHYAKFLTCVLRILLHGEWDASSLLNSPATVTGQVRDNRVSNWITSASFSKCANSTISASELLSSILKLDPELSFMPYLLGIYLFHGSLVLLLFADRMSSVHGGPHQSVERACETVIRAHEACIVTLDTHFQRAFRKVMRTTLFLVRARGPDSQSHIGELSVECAETNNSNSASLHGRSVSDHIMDVYNMRKQLAESFRWDCGGNGLAT